MAPHPNKLIESAWANLQMQSNKVYLSLLSEQSNWVQLKCAHNMYWWTIYGWGKETNLTELQKEGEKCLKNFAFDFLKS